MMVVLDLIFDERSLLGEADLKMKRYVGADIFFVSGAYKVKVGGGNYELCV